MKPAVPKYLAEELFSTAPPGHRFGLYFPIWNVASWDVSNDAKMPALKRVLEIPRESSTQIDALQHRSVMLLSTMPESEFLVLGGVASSPLITGMGMEHPLENGFAFLNPYGIPYLPGSSIKGVLRQAAVDLAARLESGWNDELVGVLFGHEDAEDARRGALIFLDSIPRIKGRNMVMDVMTPHYGDYYQGNGSPHDAGKPNPIVFLAIPPGTEFCFIVMVSSKKLLLGLRDVDWKKLLQAAYEHAFKWFGFGAKTSVGYGNIERDPKLEDEVKKMIEERKQIEEKKRRLESELSGLPEDVRHLRRKAEENGWGSNNNIFFVDIESFLEGRSQLSKAAFSELVSWLEKKWHGITENPDATKGKKNKPKYNERPRNLTKRVLAMKPGE